MSESTEKKEPIQYVERTVRLPKLVIEFLEKYLDFSGCGETLDDYLTRAIVEDVDGLLDMPGDDFMPRENLIERHGLKAFFKK